MAGWIVALYREVASMSGTIDNPLQQLLAAFGLPVQSITNTSTITGAPLAGVANALGGPVPEQAPAPTAPVATPAAPGPVEPAGNLTPAIAGGTDQTSGGLLSDAVVAGLGGGTFPNIFGVDFPAGATIFGIPIAQAMVAGMK